MADPNPYSANGSIKRSNSKPNLPPLSVPPGHVAFRMLCHASRIGGVIGKSGAVIKNLQQVTGAKIRIEDAPLDASDRVVVVIAPAAITGKIFLATEQNGNGGGDSDDGGVEVSKAQEALLKVFERVLDVAAESDGIDVVDGFVSCRLLADTAQVGSVIGKGGRVVEKIRKDTGCKIMALRECVPDYLLSSDELIKIEGNVSSVRKALVAVSRRLQDCSPADRTKMMGSKPHEVVQHETSVVPRDTLTDLHVNLQRNSAPSTVFRSTNNYDTEIHSLSADFNRVASLDSKALHREVMFRILCNNDRIGCIIGKGGSVIKALENDSGATISVGPLVAECEDRLITITAPEFRQNPESRYSPAQKAVVLVFSKAVEAGIKNGLDPGLGSPVTARIIVPSNQVGCLLGKGGAIVSEMRKATGAFIRIIGTDQVPKCASDNDQVVQISGDFSNVQDALYNATSRLRDNLFASTQNSAGIRNISVSCDTSPYGRLGDSVSLGGQPTIGISHTMNKHISSQSIDYLGHSRNLDSPLPGLWTPPAVSRGINDVGRRSTSLKGGLEPGSGSKTAIVKETTVEIVVPDDAIGSLYGEDGSNLERLKQISGASVIVHEPQPGEKDRKIVISGTPDETQAAQSLLQAFIFTGS